MLSLMVDPRVIRLRNGLRRNAFAQRLYQRWMAAHDYEQRFGERLLDAVDDTSVVWDIGANVGLYTEQILARGARTVVAFEPAPAAVQYLLQRFGPGTQQAARVKVMPVALSDQSGLVPFLADGAAVTNGIVAGTTSRADVVEVRAQRADEVARHHGLSVPNVVKVDVEGFELEVLAGFGHLLSEPALRSVFVEVHFSRLHQRGLDDAPTRISALLKQAGFKVSWLDLSHACAERA